MKTIMYLTVHKLGAYQPVEGQRAILQAVEYDNVETLKLGTWTHRHGAWQIRIEGPAGFEVVEEHA